MNPPSEKKAKIKKVKKAESKKKKNNLSEWESEQDRQEYLSKLWS